MKMCIIINCELGKEKDIIQDMKQIECVNEVRQVWGAYDIIAEIDCDEDKMVNQIKAIRSNKYIRSTMTLTVTS